MKSRSQELLERSLSAMVSAIEIYNKPNFPYRGETFSILAINSWELLLKSKWLSKNKNRLSSLYVYEQKNNKNGKKSRKKTIKQTRSGNPFTHSIDYIAKKLIDSRELNPIVWKNIEALVELRDSAIHFYNYTEKFTIRLQEIGTATLKNYVLILKEWFNKDLSSYNFYLMPLSFASIERDVDLLILNNEEKKFFKYIEMLEESSGEESDYSVTLNIDIQFIKSKARDAIKVAISDSPDAFEIRLTEEQIREKYPWDFNELIMKCWQRYSDFKVNSKFHEIKKSYSEDKRYITTRLLDPGNPKSSKKQFFSPNFFNVLDNDYTKNA